MGSFYYRRVLGAILLMSILVLSVASCGPEGSPGPSGPPGPQGPPGPSGSAAEAKPLSISVSSTVINSAVKTIDVYGSGFTPGSIVTVGIPGLPTVSNLPNAKGFWFGIATVNQFGAFTVSVNLAETLWLLEGELSGVYTVMVKNEKLNEVATAALVVEKAEEKK